MNKNDTEDIFLLYNHPEKLLEKYRNYFIALVKNTFRAESNLHLEAEDIVQDEYEKLLNGKLERIKKYYKKDSSVRTYLSRIFINHARMINKKGARRFKLWLVFREHADNRKDIETLRDDFDEIYKFLDEILLSIKEREKFELCTKLLYRIPIKEKDVKICFTDISDEDLQAILKKYSDNIKNVLQNKKEVYLFITEVFNKYEIKTRTPEAIRKWYEYKQSEIKNYLGKRYNEKFDNKMIEHLMGIYYLDYKT